MDVVPIIHYVHNDQLSGANVVTNASGTIEELSDYYPYGSSRMEEKSTSFSEQRKYAGTMRDDNTGLDYMQARYYNNQRGQFLSEDPVHLALGDAGLVQQITGGQQQAYLADPQQLNSYAYARNNPISKSDPNGQLPTVQTPLGYAVAALVGGYAEELSLYYDSINTGYFYSESDYMAAFSKGAITTTIGTKYGPWGAGAAEFAGTLAEDYSLNKKVDVGQASRNGVSAVVSSYMLTPLDPGGHNVTNISSAFNPTLQHNQYAVGSAVVGAQVNHFINGAAGALSPSSNSNQSAGSGSSMSYAQQQTLVSQLSSVVAQLTRLVNQLSKSH